MNVRDLREKYLGFFESKGHLRYPSGSLIPYDATGRLDESLLFNGAGMIQFKPYFRGAAQPENRRLTTAQKCMRTGDIESVGDATHLTFFEMMGNFSFGDYDKAEAIAFSWEFLTSKEWLGLDPKRLAFTIFDADDEAYEEWSRWLTPAGIEPSSRIFRLDEESNYWPAGSFTKGPPGPCGPNSEMFYWVSDAPPPMGEYGREQFLADDAADNWVEIWNDVFITYDWQGRLKNPSRPAEGYVKEGLPELPFRSIDTGMGLERTAMVLGGRKNVYEADVFQPVLRKLRALQGGGFDGSEGRVSAERIIADHGRAACFCIADGVLPSNGGRGYVLRRLIRRAVLKGKRALGFEQPFFHEIHGAFAESMGDFYTELRERADTIVETLRNEESQFRRTLDAGSSLLEEELSGMKAGETMPGAVAFRLYDTYGFPLEVTEEIASERGCFVDLEGYEAALKEAQTRSRAGQERETVYGGVSGSGDLAVADAPVSTEFSGYLCVSGEAKIVRVKPVGDGRVRVALDRTPFYAESGGQVGDKGAIRVDGTRLEVLGTTKNSGVFWHELKWADSPKDLLGKTVTAEIDEGRRDAVRRNHTATHLLHAALRSVLGTHVAQAGSYVGPEGLRFDFTHGKAMDASEVAEVERIVNLEILKNTPVVTYVDIAIDEAKSRGAMALFGEKYGAKVRMVEVGDFSRELCGGTHVRSTGEVGLFKIASENSAASGVRRIEAITGEAAYNWAVEVDRRTKELSSLLKTTPKELVGAVERVVEQAKEERRKREKAELSALSKSDGGEGASVTQLNGVVLWRRNLGGLESKLASQAVDDAAAGHANQVTLAASVGDGKITFYCKVGADAISRGAHAGNLLREVSKIAGGGGGGRAEFATAGGKQPEKLDEALEAAEGILKGMILS